MLSHDRSSTRREHDRVHRHWVISMTLPAMEMIMSKQVVKQLFLGVLILLVLGVGSVASQDARATEATSSISDLLKEVRELRADLRRLAVANVRVQVLVARMTAEQQ